MQALKSLTRMALTAGALALVAVGVAHLALTDIAHGGEDLSLEWRTLRACAFVIVLAQALGLAALWRWMKSERFESQPVSDLDLTLIQR